MAGVPSREEKVRDFIESQIHNLVDSVSTDVMGNLIAVKKSSNPEAKKVMLAAHMDEIGFLVKHIDDNGFLRVHNVGGFDMRNLFSRHVDIHTEAGETIPAVMNPSGKPLHISSPEDRKKIPELNAFFLDTGLAADTVKEKVAIGDFVTLRQECIDMGEVVTGKALDDRINCYILIELLKQLKDSPFEIHAVFTVQEEVGLRGAQSSAFSIAPDIAIALDTTLAVDIPGVAAELSITRMGEGVGIKVMDRSFISTRWLFDAFIKTADENNIAYQREILTAGGTDAGNIQRSRAGVASITLSIPSRNVHTVTEMVAKDDVQGSIDLLKAFLSKPLG